MGSGPRSDSEELPRRLFHLYDEFRTVVLNRKYYGHQLKNAKRRVQAIDLSVAIGTSSTVSAWTIFGTPGGRLVWSIIGAIASILAIAKVALQLSAGVERYTKLHTGYSDLCFDLKRIVDEVQITQQLPAEAASVLKNVEARFKDLNSADDITPNKILVRRFFEQTQAELPASSFWIP